MLRVMIWGSDHPEAQVPEDSTEEEQALAIVHRACFVKVMQPDYNLYLGTASDIASETLTKRRPRGVAENAFTTRRARIPFGVWFGLGLVGIASLALFAALQ